MPPSTIRKANKASTADLSLSIPSSEVCNGFTHHYTVATSSSLTNEDRDLIWEIFETNMRDYYNNSSFGWDPPSKKAEMFDPLSRFILVRQSPNLNNGDSLKNLVAYTIFRFEREDREDVVYCYELQVSKDAQRRGLGKVLTQQLADIGSKWSMRKVMLTALKVNTAALKFYQSAGFTADPTSPEYQSEDEEGWADDEEEVYYDYQILSKIIRPTERGL